MAATASYMASSVVGAPPPPIALHRISTASIRQYFALLRSLQRAGRPAPLPRAAAHPARRRAGVLLPRRRARPVVSEGPPPGSGPDEPEHLPDALARHSAANDASCDDADAVKVVIAPSPDPAPSSSTYWGRHLRTSHRQPWSLGSSSPRRPYRPYNNTTTVAYQTPVRPCASARPRFHRCCHPRWRPRCRARPRCEAPFDGSCVSD